MAASVQANAGQTVDTVRRDAASEALDKLTDDAAGHHDPKHHLHFPGNSEKAGGWFANHTKYKSLAEFENSWHLGNYVIHRDSGKKEFEAMSIYVRVGMHLLYYGSEQEKALHWARTQKLLEEQSVKMGRQYDDPKSKDHIQPFIESFNLQGGLADLAEPDPTKYNTFNEFFARKLKPNARPIAEPQNGKVVSSPADCRLTAFPTVDLATRYWIKGTGFTLAKLLGSEELARSFDGGSIIVARLAPQDYHRWHSPINGTVVSEHNIPGSYYTVNPQAINEPGTLDVFCENRRSVMVFKRAETSSPVAVVAVGAMLVGSLKYSDSVCDPPGSGKVKIGAQVKRGEDLGAFYYGGSTVIVVYPKGEIQLDEDLVKNSTEQNCETLMSVGWRVGAST